MRPVILYELNEVPWRVFDRFVEQHPTSHIAKLLREGRSLTTVSSDSGELHPWSTWPSLHRGVPNTRHEITFINQEIRTPFLPVWELLAEQGLRVGVFGSLQSYQRFPSDLARYAFFVPDTFSPSPKTFPQRYQAFQSLNLTMTERDGAQAREGVPMSKGVVASLARMAATGMRPSTVGVLAQHLWRERRNPAYRTRRSIMQAPLAFDFYLDALKRETPHFSTFFTNHVAGMMHRYWSAAFPEDFSEAPRHDSVRAANIDAAMRIADAQIGTLLNLIAQKRGLLIVATSMGQEAVDRGTYLGELRLEDPTLFFRAIGYHEKVDVRLAMQPDFSFETQSAEAALRLSELAQGVHDSQGESLFHSKLSGPTVNLNLRPTKVALLENRLVFGGNTYAPEALGMTRLMRDQGTGYHQPKGALIAWGRDVRANQERTEIPLESVAPTILNWFECPRPDYMMAPVALRAAR